MSWLINFCHIYLILSKETGGFTTMKLNKIIFVLITSLVLLSDLLPPAHNMYAKANGNAKPVITELSDDDNVIITQK